MSLFMLHRPGLLAVSGKITEVDGVSVTIQGDVFLPVSKKVVKRLVRIIKPMRFSERMNLKVGEDIVAITEDEFSINSLFEGAETDDELYELQGYNIRYGGVFDFVQSDENEEEHLFSGQIKTAKIINGGKYQIVMIHVRSQNQNEVRYLIDKNDKTYTVGHKVVALCGKVYKEKGIDFYPIKNVSIL